MSASESLIVITSASGRQGAHLIPRLYSNPSTHLRLVVKSESSRATLSSQYPNASVVQADLTDRSQLHAVLVNATHVYHIGPSFHPHETQIGYNVIDAAVTEAKNPGSSFKHFVYSSVLNTQLRKLLNHDCKRYVEEYLMESGLNYTILQPSHFMDNIPVKMLAKQASPVFPAGYDPAIAFSFLALRDLGEASASVLMEGEKHYMAQYPICSTFPMSYNTMMETLGKVMDKRISIKRVDHGDAVKGILTRLYGRDDAPQATRDVAQRLLLYYDNHGLKGNPNVLGWLLGRKPTQPEEWVRSQLEEDKGN